MRKESINTADRKYNIRYYSNSDKNARYNYVLPSLKTLISEKREYFIVSKISGDKPYSVEKAVISEYEGIFTYEFNDFQAVKEDIKGIMTNYKDKILFFEIGVFADLYSYLRSHFELDIINYLSDDGKIDISNIEDNVFDKLPIKKDKLIKRMQNYYDDNKNCILPSYKVQDSIIKEDKRPSNKVLYSVYHLPVLEKIYYFENFKLNLKDIADIFFSDDNNENIDKSLLKKILSNKIKLIEESIKHLNYTELTKRIDNFKYIEEISLSKIIEHIFSLYYVFQHDNVLRDSYISSISIILDTEIKEYLSLSEYFSSDAIYFDKMFYHFAEKIKYLYLEGYTDIFSIGLDFLEEELIKYQYDEVLKLCIDKYNEMKNELKELFSELYSNNTLKTYGMYNLNHENYFENKFKSILNYGHHYVSLILKNYDFLRFLCSFIRFRINYDVVESGEDIVFSNVESKEYGNKKMHNIDSIIDDINTFFYIAESMYFFNPYTAKSYKDILDSLHSSLMYLYRSSKENKKDYNLLNELKNLDLKDAKKYEDIFINNALFFYNQENIYNEEDEKRLEEKVKEIEYEEIKFKEEENRERKIFFDANYKTIYKAVMYDIRLKEHEEYDKKYIEEAFINALEYMYRVSYYKEYLIINNARLTNQYKKSEIRLEKDKKLKTADLSKEIKDIKNV
ncbi:hypothetical protein [Brachyspira innocens]|uniref:hypothetical protein n=1 Tax=Brachyspira innocens TaxID=13264 RepID=UPI0026ED7FD9|nr:hypothetical protein [Brachyspira innocens]